MARLFESVESPFQILFGVGIYNIIHNTVQYKERKATPDTHNETEHT
jgi:hypothetical protein